ncbi:MAG: hypothetical protein AAF799_48115 [Myxococcota bacterium]
MSTNTNSDEQDTVEIDPPYVCETFGASAAEETRMQKWLNIQARKSYRLVDRAVLASGGTDKRISCVMERRPAATPSEGAA